VYLPFWCGDEESRALGISRRRWEDEIEKNFQEVEWRGILRIETGGGLL